RVANLYNFLLLLNISTGAFAYKLLIAGYLLHQSLIMNFLHLCPMRNTIKAFYSNEMEKDRWEQDLFKLEGIRTKEIVGRYLSKASLSVADIGGGTGYYSF